MSTTRSNGHNGSQAAPGRDEVARLATYYAAVHGYYDTSTAAQKSGLLSITFMDTKYIPGESLPQGASHRFYVCVDGTGYMVTRYHDGRYETITHDQMEQQGTERMLRELALDYGLWHVMEESYRRDASPDVRGESRKQAILELLAEAPNEQREEADPIPHAVIMDEEPSIFLAPASPDQPALLVSRQWLVKIGPWHACHVGLLGFNEDGQLECATMDADDEDGYFDESDFADGEEGNED